MALSWRRAGGGFAAATRPGGVWAGGGRTPARTAAAQPPAHHPASQPCDPPSPLPTEVWAIPSSQGAAVGSSTAGQSDVRRALVTLASGEVPPPVVGRPEGLAPGAMR